jgi:hypothetical protein
MSYTPPTAQQIQASFQVPTGTGNIEVNAQAWTGRQQPKAAQYVPNRNIWNRNGQKPANENGNGQNSNGGSNGQNQNGASSGHTQNDDNNGQNSNWSGNGQPTASWGTPTATTSPTTWTYVPSPTPTASIAASSQSSQEITQVDKYLLGFGIPYYNLT